MVSSYKVWSPLALPLSGPPGGGLVNCPTRWSYLDFCVVHFPFQIQRNINIVKCYARWNPTLWNYHTQNLPLNSLGKRIMSLSSDHVASFDTSSSDNVEENLPGASKGARPSNWLSVFLLLLNQLQSVKNIAVSLEYQIGFASIEFEEILLD